MSQLRGQRSIRKLKTVGVAASVVESLAAVTVSGLAVCQVPVVGGKAKRLYAKMKENQEEGFVPPEPPSQLPQDDSMDGAGGAGAGGVGVRKNSNSRARRRRSSVSVKQRRRALRRLADPASKAKTYRLLATSDEKGGIKVTRLLLYSARVHHTQYHNTFLCTLQLWDLEKILAYIGVHPISDYLSPTSHASYNPYVRVHLQGPPPNTIGEGELCK